MVCDMIVYHTGVYDTMVYDIAVFDVVINDETVVMIWPGLEFGKSQRSVENRVKWRKLVAKSSVVPHSPVCQILLQIVVRAVIRLEQIVVRAANPMDPVLSHHTSQERQPAAMPELPNNKPHQSPKQSHAEGHTEYIEATSAEDHRRRTGRLQSRKEYHRADLQPTHSL